MKISAYYPNYFKDQGIGHACYWLIKGMQSEGNQISLTGIASEPLFSADFYSDIFPRWSKSIVYKVLPDNKILNLAESLFLKRLPKDIEIAYLWPGISLEAYQSIKKKGYKIIFEGVNTPAANIKTILDAEYISLSLPVVHGITQETIDIELTKLELSDYVYSCSPILTASMLEIGVPKSKLLQTSYGLSSSAILNASLKQQTTTHQPTFIFVGSIGVRKGVHLLLNYWVKAKLNAKLILVGNIDEVIKPIVMPYFGKHNIEHVPFTTDLPSIYKNADVFILPSLEEGSPLVTYLALGAGLPVIVSPMGGGGVIVDGEDGFVIEPHDESKWLESMRLLAEDEVLREKLSKQSQQKALNYTWDIVGADRLNSLLLAEGLSQ